MVEKFQNKYRVPSARAAWHEYNGGVYFITICTKNREHYFGKIDNEGMKLSEIGQYAEKCWREIPQHFPHVEIPIWVVMPNHIHGIIKINPICRDAKSCGNAKPRGDAKFCRDAKFCVSTSTSTPPPSTSTPMKTTNKFGPQSKNLASVIRGFKIGVTKFANENNIPFAWQTRFHDHIVRNQNELNRIAKYIENNVVNWYLDTFHK
ncbi:MAG: hypothetical protein MJ197_03845 [Bacteroidales bacterium]|nr:hypothetical protein [Bacteroidales bacterium]